MNIVDFIPKYPLIDSASKLNVYTDPFNLAIYKKKEFHDNRLSKTEVLPPQQGAHTKYQINIARYLSSHTPYNSLLLVHDPGTGKTCSAIGSIELIRNEMKSENMNTYTGALILASGDGMLNTFSHELIWKCTSGMYIPANYDDLTDLEKVHRQNKNIKEFYKLETFEKFAKVLAVMPDAKIVENFSNMIVVIDEIHNIRIKTTEANLDVYKQFHRFTHLIRSSKFLLLSGTPMKDQPDEIASVMNLLLPLTEQLPTGDDFKNEYMTAENTIRPDKKDELKTRFKGRISFLRENVSNVKRNYIGEPMGKLKHFKVVPCYMSEFQSDVVTIAKGDGDRLFTSSREASLFVFPDKSYSTTGSKQYITEQKHISQIVGKKKTSTEISYNLTNIFTSNSLMDELKKYSAIYSKSIEIINNADTGNIFIYNSSVAGSGCILFSLILEKLGYKKANGKEKTHGKRYMLLTSSTSSANEIKRLVNRFNQADNYKGDFIRIVIGSKVVSEGFSFNNVTTEIIQTPHWNYSETIQAIARGIRFASHTVLLHNGYTPDVKIYQLVSIPYNRRLEDSVFLYMYEISEDKDIAIRSVLRLMMESAFDCALNYNRNYIDGVDGERLCDYTDCKFECDDVSEHIINDDNLELDYSTYNIYYTSSLYEPLRILIGKILKIHREMSASSLIEYLKDNYTDSEVMANIKLAIDRGAVKYDTYVQYYTLTSPTTLSLKIDNLYKTRCTIHLTDMIELLNNEFSLIEVVTVLNTFITNHTPIINRYGIISYIREYKNNYFLTHDSTSRTDYYSSYYTENQLLLSDVSKNINDSIASEFEQAIVSLLCASETYEQFSKNIKKFNVKQAETFLEYAILPNHNHVKMRDFFTRYYDSNIIPIENVIISNLLYITGPIKGYLRVCRNGVWSDCVADEAIATAYIEHTRQQKQEIEKYNQYSLVGFTNDQSQNKDVFCLKDITNLNTSTDSRKNTTGRVCTTYKKDILSEFYNRIFPTRAAIGTAKNMCDDIQHALTEEKLVYNSTQCGVTAKQKKELTEVKEVLNPSGSKFESCVFMYMGDLTAVDVDIPVNKDRANFIGMKAKLVTAGTLSGIVGMDARVAVNNANPHLLDKWYVIRKTASAKVDIGYFHVSEDRILDLCLTATYCKVNERYSLLHKAIYRMLCIVHGNCTIVENYTLPNYAKRKGFLQMIGFSDPINIDGTYTQFTIEKK
jgi:superfamily II DNA or RNA helicase